jgi:hypothetical protein
MSPRRLVSAKPKDKQQRLVDAAQLVEGQVTDLIPKGARVDGADYLAHGARGLFTDSHLRMKGGGRRRL